MSSENTALNNKTSARLRLKPQNLIARIALYFALFVVLLIFVIWLAIPPIAKWYATDFYEQRNRAFTAADIGVNFFPPTINLKEIEVLNQQTPELKVNNLTLQVSILPLFQKTVRVSKADIDGLYVFASQEGSNWTVAGVTIDGAAATQESSKSENAETDISAETNTTDTNEVDSDSNANTNSNDSTATKPTPWSVLIPTFVITNSEFKVHNLLKDGLTDTIKIAKFQADNLKNQGIDVSTSIDLDLFFNQHSNVVLSSDFDYKDSLADVTVSSFSVSTDVADVTHFLPIEYQNVAGQIQTSVRGSIQQKSATEFDIQLSDFNTELNKVDIALPDITTKLDQLNLNIATLDVSNSEQGELQLSASLNTLLTNIDANIQNNKVRGDTIAFGVKDIALSKHDEKLSITAPSVTYSSQNLAFKNEAIDASNSGTQVELGQLSLNVNNDNAIDLTTAITTNLLNSSVTTNGVSLINQALSTRVKDLSLSIQDAGMQASALNTTISNTGFKVSESDNTLAALQSLNIDSPQLTYSNETFDAVFSIVDMQQITLSDMANAPALTTLEQLSVKNAKASSNNANIDDIQLKGLKVNVLLDESRQLINLATMPASSSESEMQTAPSDTMAATNNAEIDEQSNEGLSSSIDSPKDRSKEDTDSSSFNIAINTFDLTGESYIQLLDKGVDPDLDTKIDIEKLSASNIDSSDPASWTHVELDAKNGKYSTIDLDADIQPFAQQLTMKSKLAIRETDLPPYSPYIAQALGYRIESGQMDADLTLNSDQGQLEGDTHLVFREFDLGGRQESSQVMQTGAMPLNIAVGVLKDGQGNIELNIPLEGNVDNPKFKWTGFLMLPIKQALYKASASYLMQTFVPYANVISIAQIAGEQILKIRVEPLAFEPQQGQIIASQHEYLNQLSALMTDKADSQVKACGVSALVDLGEENELTIAEPEQQNVYLNDLANQRANALKDYLVEKGIASNRIFVCAPEIDRDNDALPRVELEF